MMMHSMCTACKSKMTMTLIGGEQMDRGEDGGTKYPRETVVAQEAARTWDPNWYTVGT